MAVYEGTKITVDYLLDYYNSTLSNKPARKPESPNHADPFSLEAFERTLEELAEPFNKVLEAHYAEQG